MEIQKNLQHPAHGSTDVPARLQRIDGMRRESQKAYVKCLRTDTHSSGGLPDLRRRLDLSARAKGLSGYPELDIVI